jgi:hypothetical protein
MYQDPHDDMGKGEVKLKSIYPLDVYVDPNARDTYFQDAANILICRLMTDEQAEREFPDYMDIIKNAAEKIGDRYPSTDLEPQEDELFLGDIDDQYHTKREFIDRYSRITVNTYHVFEPDSGYENTFEEEDYKAYKDEPAIVISTQETRKVVTDEAGLAELSEMLNVLGPVFHMVQTPQIDPATGQMIPGQPQPMPGPEQGEFAVPGSTTYLEPTNKGALIDSEMIMMNVIQEYRIKIVASVGDSLLYTRILPCSDYPILPLVNVHLRNPYPLSDVRIYKPIQKYINKIRSLIIAHASTSTNVKLLVPRGSVNKKEIEEEWARAGTAVVEYDAELGTPVVAGPVPLPNELYKNEADAKYDLEYGFGIHDIMMGSTQNMPSTFRGTVAIDEYGQRRAKSRQADVESFLNQCGKIAVPLMQQLYTEEKIVRLVQPDGSVRETQFNQAVYDEFSKEIIGKINDVTTGKYDIVVVSASTLPSNRWAQFDTYLEMYKSGIIDQVEVLKKTEVVDTEGVLQRMSLIQQLQAELEQAQALIKKLKGDLQTSEREEVHAKKRLEVEKFKAGLAEPKEKAKKASALYDARLQDELQKVKDSVSSFEKVKPAPTESGRS